MSTLCQHLATFGNMGTIATFATITESMNLGKITIAIEPI